MSKSAFARLRWETSFGGAVGDQLPGRFLGGFSGQKLTNAKRVWQFRCFHVVREYWHGALAQPQGGTKFEEKVWTPNVVRRDDEQPEERQNTLLDTLTLRRWGSTADVANLICFLSSDQAAYITGTMIDVSGGKLATQIPRLAYDRAGKVY